MREVEITCKVRCDKDEIIKILEDKGFTQSGYFELNDVYYSTETLNDLTSCSYYEVFKRALLVREIIEKDNSIKQLVYKNKNYDEDKLLISEEKYTADIVSIASTRNVLENLLTKVLELKQHNYIFTHNNIKLYLQEVDNVGLFIELEQLPKHKFSNDFNKIKTELIEIINSYNLPIESDYDVKKTFIALDKHFEDNFN